MTDDPISKCIKSGTIKYMRWEMIPLLNAAGKKKRILEYTSVGLVSVLVAASGGSCSCWV